MKVLGLFSATDKKEYCIIYVSSDPCGKDLVNGQAKTICAVEAGKSKDLSGEELFCIVISSISDIGKGDIIHFTEDETVLKVLEKDDNGLIHLSVERSGFVSVSSDVRSLRPISVGILAVSDSIGAGNHLPILESPFTNQIINLGAEIHFAKAVPQNREVVVATLTQWIDSLQSGLILIIGGTGLSERDITPESLDSINGKVVPGIGERMRAQKPDETESISLSRIGAVVKDRTLIISLPENIDGAIRSFSAIAPIIREAIENISRI